MNDNFTMLVGFPNVGKSTIRKELEKQKGVFVFDEDKLFVELLNKLMVDWPNFENYQEFREWRISHREETEFLFDKSSENTMESLYQSVISNVKTLASNDRGNKYILDMGGYAYARQFSSENIIYLQ